MCEGFGEWAVYEFDKNGKFYLHDRAGAELGLDRRQTIVAIVSRQRVGGYGGL